MCLLKATYSQILVYIATITKGKRNRSGAKININITAITEPKIKPLFCYATRRKALYLKIS